MDAVIKPLDIRWTVLISGLLHAGALLFLAMKISNAQVVPIGVEVLYTDGSAKVPSVQAQVKPRIKARPVLEKSTEAPSVKENLQPVSEPVAASLSQGPAGRHDGVVVSALERYKYELRLFLESRKIYPEAAKRLHQSGTVIVQFKVSAAGELSDVNLSEPSHSEALNRAAFELVKRASNFKPFPKEVQVDELKLALPIEYVL